MKIRKGFVSNSSASSFVCNFCGEIQSGWELDLGEASMYECENNHIFCENHIMEDVTINDKRDMVLNDDVLDDEEKERVKKLNDNEFGVYFDEEYENGREDIPTAFCPICRFKHITDFDLIRYLLKRAQKTRKEILSEIAKKCLSYNDFEDMLRE